MTTTVDDDPAEPGRGANGERSRVLVVDDEPAWAQLVAESLADDGFLVTTAIGGDAALRTLVAEDFDAVVLDHHMPDVDGLEVLHWIRQRSATADLPTIMLTADHDPGSWTAELHAGADLTMHKPVELEVLAAQIRREIAKRSSWKLTADLAQARAQLAAGLLGARPGSPAVALGLVVGALAETDGVVGAAVVVSLDGIDRIHGCYGAIRAAEVLPDGLRTRSALRARLQDAAVVADGDLVRVPLRRHGLVGHLVVRIGAIGPARRDLVISHLIQLAAVAAEAIDDVTLWAPVADDRALLDGVITTGQVHLRIRELLDTDSGASVGCHVAADFPLGARAELWQAARRAGAIEALWRCVCDELALSPLVPPDGPCVVDVPVPEVLGLDWVPEVFRDVDELVVDVRDWVDGPGEVTGPMPPVLVAAGGDAGADVDVAFVGVGPDVVAGSSSWERAQAAAHRWFAEDLGARLLADPVLDTEDLAGLHEHGIALAARRRSAAP